MSVCSAALVATAFNWFSCPLFPRPPSPAGKGEIYSYLMQGAPPLASPGLEPGRHWGQGANYVLGGRCAFLVSGCHCLPLAFLLPIPPTALAERSSPPGKGEIFSLFCRGLRPRHPGLNLRGTGLSRGSDCLGWHFPWNRHERRPNNRFIREKFWGVWGTLSRVPPAFPPLPLMRW